MELPQLKCRFLRKEEFLIVYSVRIPSKGTLIGFRGCRFSPNKRKSSKKLAPDRSQSEPLALFKEPIFCVSVCMGYRLFRVIIH